MNHLKPLTSIKNPFIDVPIRHLYICRDTSTTIEDSLQIRPFMQNKANFRKSQMNVTSLITADYENKTLGERGKNKPNSNPKQTQTKPIFVPLVLFIVYNYR